jgi:hypothetical protein
MKKLQKQRTLSTFRSGLKVQSAKYESASTFAFDACFVWKLAPLADESSGLFVENLSRPLTRSRTYKM